MYARRLLRGQNTIYTNQRPEKYISNLISLQWDFNLLVCLQNFSFAFHKSLHKSLQLLLLKFTRKSCQCVGEVCIFDNPLFYTEFVPYLDKKIQNEFQCGRNSY